MNKYIVIYHASPDALARSMNTPPEEAAEGMKLWHQWAEKCGDHMIDLGTPLGFGQKINVDGSSADSTRHVCGYSLLQAESMDEARRLLQGHPHLSGWDASCEIEVHEAMALPG